MQSLKYIFRQNFPEVTYLRIIAWVAIIIGGPLLGLCIAYFSFRQGLDLGDGSTFFSFAHNLANGEVIYKDFIHFRTPGSYFLQALFINIFGDQPSSVQLALRFESQVLYTFFFTLALAIFLRFKYVVVGALATLFTVMLPPYAQLRTVLAFLAVALYVQAYRTLGKRSAWLMGAGLFTGLAFTFGQEAALMSIVTIGLMELIQIKKRGLLATLKRIGIVSLGVLIGVLPLLIYVFLQSDVSTFIYYTFYYAFILQPQGMDLVYPPISHGNLIFYIVFALYIGIFGIFYCCKKLGIIEGALLVFGIMRLVTLLGRSDIGHLLFILPELFFLTLYAIVHIKDAKFSYINTRRFAMYTIAFVGSLFVATNTSSAFLIVSAAIVYLALYSNQLSHIESKHFKNANSIVLAGMTATLAVFLYILYPSLTSTIDSMSTRGLTQTQIGGLNVTPATYTEVMGVSEAVKSYHPTTLFSYPVQPYYYSLAPKHAARFMTFEPQTTETEQDQTIEDLKRTRPEVILYDPVQAGSLSEPLGKINTYIRNNYKIEHTIEYSRMYWIMVPNKP